jgi:lipopolysaccharide/colanic/teichoic acid biosynthesis glycosyltransferase
MESFTPLSTTRSYYPAALWPTHGRTHRTDRLYRLFKLVFDLLIATVLFAAVVPIMGVIAVLIKLDTPGPIIYRRQVVGENGRPFLAFKFRTMYTQGDELLATHPHCQQELAHYAKIRNDPRVTPLGRWLRRTSLAELPQLLTVLNREMSLIGPRMVTPEELLRFGDFGPLLVSVKPGISGLWQVSGRADAPYEERIYLNMIYISQWSPWLDMFILLRTIPVVFSGRGAY